MNWSVIVKYVVPFIDPFESDSLQQTASNKKSIQSVAARIQNLNESIIKRGAMQDLDETKRRNQLERCVDSK